LYFNDTTTGGSSYRADMGIVNDGGLYFSTTGTLNTVPTERMRIDSTGNVGIGTSSPATAISGDAQGLAIQHSNVPFLSLDHTGASGKRYTLYSNSAGALVTYDEDAAAERMRIDSTGHLIVPNGITLGTAVGTYNAANTLDDYEEGTWTPDLNATGGNPSNRVGHYVKVGNKVTASFYIQLTTGTSLSSTAQLNITGLPFASNTAALQSYSIEMDQVSNSDKAMARLNSNNTSLMLHYRNSGGSYLAITNTAVLGTNSYFVGSITYITS